MSGYACQVFQLMRQQNRGLKPLPPHWVTIVRPGAVATSFWDKVPLKAPADAAPPEKIAKKILEAYETKHKGQLDLI